MNARNQAGISLIEILVSLLISVFLLGGVVQVYLTNQVTFRFSNAVSEIQENGRFALDTMSQDIRHAGNWGCIGPDLNDDNVGTRLNKSSPVTFDTHWHDFINQPSIEGVNGADLDTITIRGSKPGEVRVQKPFNSVDKTLHTTLTHALEKDDIVLLTDCAASDQEADMLWVKTVSQDGSATKLDFVVNRSQVYKNTAALRELQTVTYSIQDKTAGGPALLRNELGDNEVLAEGVENLQILYGVDTDTPADAFANQYLTADLVPNFSRVVSVRVMLLLRSSDDSVTEDAQTYDFNGTTSTSSDNRLRQVFTTTIALRTPLGRS